MGSGSSAMTGVAPLNDDVVCGDLCDRYTVSCACQNKGGVAACIHSKHTVTCKRDGKNYSMVRVSKERIVKSKISLAAIDYRSNKIADFEEILNDPQDFNSQVSMLTNSKLRSSNLNQYREVMSDNSCCYLVADALDGISLAKFLMNNTPKKKEIQTFMHGILKGLQHLHKHNIYSVDLSADNITLCTTHSTFSSNDVKIINFGNRYARMALQQQSCNKKEQHIRQHADIWTAGELCYQMAVGELPFSTHRAREASRTVLGASLLQDAFSSPQWSGVDKSTQEFIKCLMSAQVDGAQVQGGEEEEAGNTAAHLLQHQWLELIPRRRLSLSLSTRRNSKTKISFDATRKSKHNILERQNSKRRLSKLELSGLKHTTSKLPTKSEQRAEEETRFWNAPTANQIDAFFAERRSQYRQY